MSDGVYFQICFVPGNIPRRTEQLSDLRRPNCQSCLTFLDGITGSPDVQDLQRGAA
jgi:hypothetical protein